MVFLLAARKFRVNKKEKKLRVSLTTLLGTDSSVKYSRIKQINSLSLKKGNHL
jgi:hypothetical protein